MLSYSRLAQRSTGDTLDVLIAELGALEVDLLALASLKVYEPHLKMRPEIEELVANRYALALLDFKAVLLSQVQSVGVALLVLGMLIVDVNQRAYAFLVLFVDVGLNLDGNLLDPLTKVVGKQADDLISSNPDPLVLVGVRLIVYHFGGELHNGNHLPQLVRSEVPSDDVNQVVLVAAADVESHYRGVIDNNGRFHIRLHEVGLELRLEKVFNPVSF